MVWLRRVMPFLGVLIVIGIIYDVFVFYSRASRDREAKQAQAERMGEQERKTAEAYGGLGLKIVTLYAAHVPGRPTNLCYGVTGAKTVRIEPPVDGVWPALTRCVQVSPTKDTEYKMIARDEAGHEVTKSLMVHVAK
jgi:hypothetical protein